jgi:hypothetical protein
LASGLGLVDRFRVRTLDCKAPSVTLAAANGVQRTLKVRDPERLQGVKVGHLVEFALTQAIAVELEKMKD